MDSFKYGETSTKKSRIPVTAVWIPLIALVIVFAIIAGYFLVKVQDRAKANATAVSIEAKNIDKQILSIGTVTLDDDKLINAIRKSYDMLPEEGKKKVMNYDLFVTAEHQLTVLQVDKDMNTGEK